MQDGYEHTIDSTKRRVIDLKELWQYRELFYFFTWRDVKVKYKQTMLGFAWVIFQPLITVTIFSFFFGRALNVDSQGIPYPVFVFSGLLLWNTFSAGVNSAGNSMLSQSGIIKKIYFPRIIIPVSAILVTCIDFLVSFAVFAALLLYYDVNVDLTSVILLWPLSILIMLIGTVGISCWLAALNIKYRDIRYIVPFALQIALFLSPVIYPTSILDSEVLNYLLSLNPMYASISLFRGPITDASIHSDLIAISAGSAVLFLLSGLYYFKKTEVYFADIA